MRTSLLSLLTVCFLFSASKLSAQEKDTTYWRKSFKVGLSLNQAAFSDGGCWTMDLIHGANLWIRSIGLTH